MLELEKVDFELVKDELKNTYIAFDSETTGLNPKENRIIELGAVLFENGKAVKKFNTLVNAEVEVSSFITELTGINNEMLENEPKEQIAYEMLKEFLNEALAGNIIICGHNARFDMSFLQETFKRLNLTGKIRYVDTLALSRKYLKGLPNYKQGTVANHLNIKIAKAHRAYDDAYVCGQILSYLINK